MSEKNEFYDSILGKCKFTDHFYITNDMYGGYSYECESGSGHVSYANPENVIDIANKAGKEIHLAGNAWKLVNKKGFGEKVSPEEAKKLVAELKQKSWTPGPWSGGPIIE